jgi:hypothetical protein
MARPVRPRWMYFVKRYLQVLNGWLRQMVMPQSCIAEEYVPYETMKVATKYFSGLNPKWALAWAEEGDERMYNFLFTKIIC